MLHIPIRAAGPARISAVLEMLADARGGNRLSVREIVDVLGERGFAIFVVLLGLPNIIPMVPPIPLLCGLLIGFVSLQMMLGRRTPWLPQALLAKDISRADVRRIVGRLIPWIVRVEQVCKPRLALFDGELAGRLIGCVLLVLAAGLLVAAPIIGQIPLGIAICLIGLGIVERDGVVVLAGASVGAVGVSLSLGFAWAIVTGLGGLLAALGF